MARKKMKATKPVQTVEWQKTNTSRGVKYKRKAIDSPPTGTSNEFKSVRQDSEEVEDDVEFHVNMHEPIPLKIPGGKVGPFICGPSIQAPDPMQCRGKMTSSETGCLVVIYI
jgi:hypothetical protein